MVRDRRHLAGPANARVVVVVYDHLCMFEFGCATEVFGLPRPDMDGAWYSFEVAAAEPGPFRALGGIEVRADGGLELLEGAGSVIVPGWRDYNAPVPAPLCVALRAAHAGGARVMSLCSGAFVLAAAGLLDGRMATTHWRFAQYLQRQHPLVRVQPDVLYVDEGSVLTAAGSAAGLDMFLHVVRQDWGPDAANRVARRLVLPAHRAAGQMQQVPSPMPPRDDEGARLTRLMEAIQPRLAEGWTLERMAGEMGMGARSLQRLFAAVVGQSPAEWLVRQRIFRAQELLDGTPLSVESVAAACGFSSAAALRHHFTRIVRMSPNSYRMRR